MMKPTKIAFTSVTITKYFSLSKMFQILEVNSFSVDVT